MNQPAEPPRASDQLLLWLMLLRPLLWAGAIGVVVGVLAGSALVSAVTAGLILLVVTAWRDHWQPRRRSQ